MEDADRLTERKEAILQAVVESYMSTSRPVGSGLVADQSELDVSSATVRKELAALEDEGFLHQPHTSAGRVPTDKGYRYFVDALMRPSTLDDPLNERIADFFNRSHGELERILTETSRLLAGVTGSAALVVAPESSVAQVRGVQLVLLEPQIVLMVVVLSTGGIERHTIELSTAMSEDQVALAQQLVADTLIDGSSASPMAASDEVAPAGAASGDDPVAVLVGQALAAHAEPAGAPRVHVGGRSQVAGVFDQTEQVAQVLQLFERQLLVVTLIRDVLDRGLRVAIGAETGVQNLNECSLVVAPYVVEGEQAGSIGVLGPTHMNYPRAMAAVAVVSNHLGDRLTRG